MKTIQKKLSFTQNSLLTQEIFTEKSIFFDIETTGFSPAHTHLYLIGCARRQGAGVCVDQFFAEQYAEEEVILSAFLELIHPYDTIITYNGIGFDIPYLKAKCEQFGLAEHFSEFTYVDIFKSVSTLKHILKLDNYKQKSIESFLGMTRNDLYSGGELIQIYKAYVKEPDDELLQLLLLHNFEDVQGMMDLIPILSYSHLFHGHFTELTETTLNSCKNYDGNTGKELILKITPEYPLPKRISYRFHELYLSGNKNDISVVIKLTEDTLKYFHPNYKEYYYLPAEDMAIHKSVAAYVDKKHRKQATAGTCYAKKQGQFLPQYNNSFITPAFFYSHGDKVSYFEFTEKFCDDDTMILPYVRHLLSVLYVPNFKI